MYYKHILYEFTLYPNREKAPSKPSFIPSSLETEQSNSGAQSKQISVKKRRMIIDTTDPVCPTCPLQRFDYILEAPPLSAVDLEVVKITAQFAAKNGRQFLQSLLQREMKNYIFDFLKPQHNIYSFFNKLVDQYTKILAPSNDMLISLKTDAKSTVSILEKARLRYEWVRYNDKERRKDIDTNKSEKTLQNLIDWNEFAVVETISFREDERTNLPPPVSLEHLGSRLLAQERQDKQKNIVVESGSTSSEAADKVKNVSNLPESIPKESSLRTDYDPKKFDSKTGAKSKFQEKYMVSPITGELVSADKMEQHLKQSLLDPRYKEQKLKYAEEKRQQDLMASSGPSITAHLKGLAERRSDIFGPGHEETVIGQTLDEKEDSHVKKAAPVHFEATAPTKPAFRVPPTSASIDKQSEAVTSVRPNSFLPNNHSNAPLVQPMPNSSLYPHGIQHQNIPSFPPQSGQSIPTQPPFYGVQPPSFNSFEGRPKFDESLVPEEEFINCYGYQIEHLTVKLTDTISALKNQIFHTTGMPVSKQKILIGAARFGKDTNTLAFYNVHSNTYIALHLKERGGKK
ncbi:hypothetical protein MXB_2064 [Myxobolus squamalis]|nr:hypothetical protein MXB_2064 [Myxobolus squamalis]